MYVTPPHAPLTSQNRWFSCLFCFLAIILLSSSQLLVCCVLTYGLVRRSHSMVLQNCTTSPWANFTVVCRSILRQVLPLYGCNGGDVANARPRAVFSLVTALLCASLPACLPARPPACLIFDIRWLHCVLGGCCSTTRVR